MEELSRIVAASMARNGCDVAIDHRRLTWSPWFRCELTESLLRVPSVPGIVALAEEVGILGADQGSPSNRDHEKAGSESLGVAQRFSAAKSQPKTGGALAPEGTEQARRLLAIFEIAEAKDLGTALIQLFAPGSPQWDRLRSGRCFARFTPVADPAERQAATTALRDWLHNSGDAAQDSANPAA
jgi:hypothetical protein